MDYLQIKGNELQKPEVRLSLLLLKGFLCMTNWESGLETYWPVGIGGGGIGAREKVKDPDKHLKMDVWMD